MTAALAATLPLLAVALVALAPAAAEACHGRHRRIEPEVGAPVPADPAIVDDGDRVLTPISGDGAAPLQSEDPREPTPSEPSEPPPTAADPSAPTMTCATATTDRSESQPNRAAAQLLAIAGALLLALDLGIAAVRRRLRFAAPISAALLLAVGSLIYLVALSPWPNWPLLVVPAAAATAIASRALVSGR